MSVNIIQGLNDYLKSSPALPENVKNLEQEVRLSSRVDGICVWRGLLELGRRGNLHAEAAIKLVLTNLEDPDSLGCFVQYRSAAKAVPRHIGPALKQGLLEAQHLQNRRGPGRSRGDVADIGLPSTSRARSRV